MDSLRKLRCLAVLAIIATMQADAVFAQETVTEETLTLPTTIFSDLSGAVVEFNGTVHTVTRTGSDSAGGFHSHTTINWNDISGKSNFSEPFGGTQAQTFNSTSSNVSTFTSAQSMRFSSPTSPRVFVVTTILHTTVTPNGRVITVIDGVTVVEDLP